MTSGDRVAAAASALIRTAFRPQGRDPAYGLDCVGLVAAALRAGGYDGLVPGDYPLASGDLSRFAIPRALVRCAGDRAGDVVACRISPAQIHLAVRVGDGIVHADAGLRRVVHRPGTPPWPIIAAWRLQPADAQI